MDLPHHAEQWARDNAPGSGYIADATTVWRLATPWYGDRLQPGFQPHTDWCGDLNGADVAKRRALVREALTRAIKGRGSHRCRRHDR